MSVGAGGQGVQAAGKEEQAVTRPRPRDVGGVRSLCESGYGDGVYGEWVGIHHDVYMVWG